MAQGQTEASSIKVQRHSVQDCAPVSAFAARRATKNPFVDTTNKDRGVADNATRSRSNTDDNNVPPPLKRQRLDYDQKLSSRQLDSQLLPNSQKSFSLGAAPDVGQADRRLVNTHTAHVDDTNNDIPTLHRTDTNRQEVERDFREGDVDTEYGTDVEDREDNAYVLVQAHEGDRFIKFPQL